MTLKKPIREMYETRARRAVSRNSPASTSAAHRSSTGDGSERAGRRRGQSSRAKEDSPARLLFAFDGYKSSLPLLERAIFDITEKLSGRQLPYALLQYIWAREIPVGTILETSDTRRVRLLVVASGPGGVGRWHSMSRMELGPWGIRAASWEDLEPGGGLAAVHA